MSFTFDRDRHEYLLDGRRLPSVTEIISEAGLLPSYEYVDDWYSERGTAVHEAIALDVRGELDEESVDEEVRPYLERARKVLGAVPLDVDREAEGPLYHPELLFAGTLDLVLWRKPDPRFMPPILALQGERVLVTEPRPATVIDWKCGPIAKPGSLIQVCAYAILYAAAHRRSMPSCRVVSLATDPPKIVTLSPTEPRYLRYQQDFMAALRLYRVREEYGLLTRRNA